MVANSLVFPGDAATLGCQIRAAPNLRRRSLLPALLQLFVGGVWLFPSLWEGKSYLNSSSLQRSSSRMAEMVFYRLYSGQLFSEGGITV